METEDGFVRDWVACVTVGEVPLIRLIPHLQEIMAEAQKRGFDINTLHIDIDTDYDGYAETDVKGDRPETAIEAASRKERELWVSRRAVAFAEANHVRERAKLEALLEKYGERD